MPTKRKAPETEFNKAPSDSRGTQDIPRKMRAIMSAMNRPQESGDSNERRKPNEANKKKKLTTLKEGETLKEFRQYALFCLFRMNYAKRYCLDALMNKREMRLRRPCKEPQRGNKSPERP